MNLWILEKTDIGIRGHLVRVLIHLTKRTYYNIHVWKPINLLKYCRLTDIRGRDRGPRSLAAYWPPPALQNNPPAWKRQRAHSGAVTLSGFAARESTRLFGLLGSLGGSQSLGLTNGSFVSVCTRCEVSYIRGNSPHAYIYNIWQRS